MPSALPRLTSCLAQRTVSPAPCLAQRPASPSALPSLASDACLVTPLHLQSYSATTLGDLVFGFSLLNALGFWAELLGYLGGYAAQGVIGRDCALSFTPPEG